MVSTGQKDPRELPAARKRFGRNVRRLRKEREWSLEELGRRSGYSKQGVNRIEQGRVSARTSGKLSLARALGVSLETLQGVKDC